MDAYILRQDICSKITRNGPYHHLRKTLQLLLKSILLNIWKKVLNNLSHSGNNTLHIMVICGVQALSANSAPSDQLLPCYIKK